MHIYATAGTTDITPQVPVPLFGSSVRTGVFQGVADRLEANVVVLRQAGALLVVVSLDLAFAGQELRSSLSARLADAMPDESLFLAASHTHFAPATDDRRPILGRMTAEYVEQLAERIADLVSRLLRESPRPVTLDYVRGEADHAINRRLRAFWHLSRRGLLLGAVVGAPNPVGAKDESVHLLRISRPDGGLLAAIWSYACHPVSFPRPLEVSADYPGRVRARLRQALGADLPVLFWQGFAGDVRPRELDRSTSIPGRARRLVLGPRFGRFTLPEWAGWADSLSECVVGVSALPPGLPVSGPMRTCRVNRPLREFVLKVADQRQVTFHGIAFGDSLTVVGVSAEVVTEYGALLRRVFDRTVTIPVAYIDEVYGYLPTGRMLREGGYEVRWFLEPFALDGALHPEVERHCVSAFRQVAAGLATSTDVVRG